VEGVPIGEAGLLRVQLRGISGGDGFHW
jgi:hypothetical protein